MARRSLARRFDPLRGGLRSPVGALRRCRLSERRGRGDRAARRPHDTAQHHEVLRARRCDAAGVARVPRRVGLAEEAVQRVARCAPGPAGRADRRQAAAAVRAESNRAAPAACESPQQRGHGVCVCVCVQRRGTWASGIRETGGAPAAHRWLEGPAWACWAALAWWSTGSDGAHCIGRTGVSLPRALTSGAAATGRVRYDARTCAQVKSGSDERSCAYRLTQEAASLVAPIGTKQVTPLHMRQYTRARTPVRTASLCAGACCRGYHGSLASPRSYCHAMCSVAQLIHPTVAELGALLHKQQDAATGASTFSDSATLAELRACALGCVLLLPRLDGADANLAVRQPPAASCTLSGGPVPDRHISRWPSRHALADRAHAPCRTGGVRRGIRRCENRCTPQRAMDGTLSLRAASREDGSLRGRQCFRPWRRFRWFGLMRLVTGWRRAGLRSRDGARQT